MSNTYSPSDAIDDITQKCPSLSLEDREDSGIGSMTPSDLERNANLDRIIGNPKSDNSDTQSSCPLKGLYVFL